MNFDRFTFDAKWKSADSGVRITAIKRLVQRTSRPTPVRSKLRLPHQQGAGQFRLSSLCLRNLRNCFRLSSFRRNIRRGGPALIRKRRKRSPDVRFSIWATNPRSPISSSGRRTAFWHFRFWLRLRLASGWMRKRKSLQFPFRYPEVKRRRTRLWLRHQLRWYNPKRKSFKIRNPKRGRLVILPPLLPALPALPAVRKKENQFRKINIRSGVADSRTDRVVSI